MTDGDSRHSQQKLTCSCQHVFQCTQAWNLMHFAKPKYWKISLPPGLYLHAANTQTTRTKCYCAPTSCSEPESDHNLVTADIWLLGRFAPKLRKRETMGRRVTDLQHLMANPQPREQSSRDSLPYPLARMLMEWQRCLLRRCYRQPLTSHHVLRDVRDRRGGVIARKRRRKCLRRGRRETPPESYCARIQATASSRGL